MRVTLARSFIGAGDQRRHDHHRPAADGDDPVQAVLEHGAERGDGAGARAGGDPDADAGAAGAAGAVRPRAVRRAGRRLAAFWDRLGAAAMARPLRSWAFTLLAMLPLSILGLRTDFIQDLMTELPADASRPEDFRLVASKFEPGCWPRLTVVLESDTDLRKSEGLALIDDVSRLLRTSGGLTEVRSATQPLGSPQPLDACPARVAAGRGERRVSSARRRGRAASEGADRGRGQAARGHLARRKHRPAR